MIRVHRARRRIALIAAAALLCATAHDAFAWQTAHGDPDNTSFADVLTIPATVPATVAGNLGSIAPGAGPVVAPDGTVYVASEQGWVMSFKPDGTPGWRRQIAQNQMIVASPAIGSDGTVYVVGITRPAEGQPPAVQRVDATLHRFNASGAYLGQTVFPQHNGKVGSTMAPPNIWRFNGTELAMVPALYPGPVGGMVDIRLLAFSPGGSVVADQNVTSIAAETTGGAGIPSGLAPLCLLPPVGTVVCLVGFSEFGVPGSGLTATMPGVGIYANPLGGTPWILLSDHDKDLVGLTYSAGESKFYETFRKHESNRYMRSAPTILANRHTVIGFEDITRDDNGKGSGAQSGGILFSGPNATKVAPVSGLQEIYGAPTQLKDGRVVLIGAQGHLTVLNNVTAAGKFRLPGTSIVPVAASRTHFFVSMSGSLHTFETATLIEVGKFSWANGGKSPPVVGPLGHVYAIAGNQMMVFPPPPGTPASTSGAGGNDAPKGGVFQAENIPAPTGQKSGVFQAESIPASPPPQGNQPASYKPPKSKNGHRLFACLELDGDDCGKQDHREIAGQFCAKEGYSAVEKFDVDTRKGKAETLQGDEYCSKKKCKVFDEIICRM